MGGGSENINHNSCGFKCKRSCVEYGLVFQLTGDEDGEG